MPQFVKILLYLLMATGLFFQALAQTESESQARQLESLQKELAERQRRLKQSQASADELREVLRRSELAIATTAKALNNTQNELTENRREQTALTKQANKLSNKIKKQQAQLAAQIRSAYMAGNYDYAKMLLNQEDALRFERVLTYYQYFNKARQSAISGFRQDIADLEAVNQRLQLAEQTLQTLLADQRRQSAELKTRQQDRTETLAKLNAKISSESEAIALLLENEEALIRAIEQAAKEERVKQSGTIVLSGLAKLKGKLLAPAQGRLQRLFGKRRQGQVRWKGIVIEGDEGSAVRTIHQGRVLYSDWLKGFGLVSIVDHGEGYMSVYGHNQALLKQAGDTVQAGETIALVGQSGGQAYPNLYFEVRHKGKALNPTQWIAF